jgi:phage terminase large subunit-like protein
MTTKRDYQALIDGIPGYDPRRDAEGFHFDEELAERALSFAETQLMCWEGPSAGKPFKLLEWQAPIIACLFGWVDDAGLRRYRETFIYVAKKNGKSPLAGFILDYMLLCDGEAGAQCYCAACDREQAKIAFNHSLNMLKHNTEIMSEIKYYIAQNEIRYDRMNGKIKCLSSESKEKDGLNSSCVVIDEVHRHESRDLIDIMLGSTATREQPLTVLITTADYDRHSVCNDKLKYAEGVMNRTIPDHRFLPVIYKLADDDDWTDESLWYKSNPELGGIKKLDEMQRKCMKAKSETGYQSTFRRLELNQMTQSATTWIPLHDWDLCKRVVLPAELTGRNCWMGLDLSATTDLTARAIVWSLGDDKYSVDVHCWIPEAKAQEKIRVDRVPYDVWRDMGLVTWTPGNSVDYAFIRSDVNRLCDEHKCNEIACDPWNATQLITQLAEEDGLEVIDFRQGFVSMSPACKEAERRILKGALYHDGNQMMRWMMGNCVIRSDPSGNIKLDKERSPNRIDGPVAMVMALARAMHNTDNTTVYATRGIRTL